MLLSLQKTVKSEQSNFVNQYNVSTGEVDCMDQNISTYMINLHTQKWLRPLFYLLLMWPSIVLTKYISNPF